LKNAFWISLTMTSILFAPGFSSGPEMVATVATSLRGAFLRIFDTPSTTCSYSFRARPLSRSCFGSYTFRSLTSGLT
jgi:hypothetical protein